MRQRRFIPAGAGNTQIQSEPRLCEAVYPRWRGEYTVTSEADDTKGGLSPLARGIRVKLAIGYDDKTVYPRWRGEYHKFPSLNQSGRGLSPLARGIPPARR
ncbi:hypothetical protein SEEK9263_06939 [Salmonella enterica subsp. enterica serovar Kentucky str. ATCC 9263]|nr:hypothetical protein SEEK9263_06939 [Salmonella enterica subsp. enterica serovar Kentucky str. ATCC 9263]